VRHLLVDLDGTLLGARNVPVQLEFLFRTLRAFRKHGGLWAAWKALAAIQRELKHAPPEVIRELTNDKRVAGAFANAIGLPVVEAEKVLNDAISAIFPRLERYFYPLQEAMGFLDWARTRYPMTLATNPVWPLEIVEMRMRWAGLEPSWFTRITHAASMHSAKPSPGYYREILQDQQLRAEDCMLIGNEFKMDLPATRVGIPVFIVTRDKVAQPVKTSDDAAPAWKGSFSNLKTMLTVGQ
jgi:FMN phosphatase YigB (HAD superfamily)